MILKWWTRNEADERATDWMARMGWVNIFNNIIYFWWMKWQFYDHENKSHTLFICLLTYSRTSTKNKISFSFHFDLFDCHTKKILIWLKFIWIKRSHKFKDLFSTQLIWILLLLLNLNFQWLIWMRATGASELNHGKYMIIDANTLKNDANWSQQIWGYIK